MSRAVRAAIAYNMQSQLSTACNLQAPIRAHMSIRRMLRFPFPGLVASCIPVLFLSSPNLQTQARQPVTQPSNAVLVHTAIKHDVSAPLATEIASGDEPAQAECAASGCGTSPKSFADEPEPDEGGAAQPVVPPPPPPPALPAAAVAVEQTSQGLRPAASMVESFDGLGSGFVGPNGTADFRNPSDNSLAVGPDHI